MKDKIKKITILSLCASMVLPTVAFAQTNYNVSNSNILLYEYEKKASLIESYGDNYDDFIEKNMYELKITQKIYEFLMDNYDNSYPNYYGGMYITEDSNNVILQIIKNNIPSDNKNEYKKYKELISFDDSIIIEYVDNDFNSLDEVNNNIIKYFSSDKVEYKNLIGNYVDVYTNKVIVEIDKNTKETQNQFKELVIDSDLITFVEKEGRNEDALNAGSGIKTKGVDNNCSMGFRAKINGNVGYITAGHCYDGTGESSTGGTVTHRQYSGSVDAAFVKKTNILTFLYNTLTYQGGGITQLNTIGLCPFLSSGTAVARSGVSSQYRAGTVTNNNYSGYWGTTYFTNLVATNVYVLGGDSGGPVFFPTNTDGGATLIGVVKGKITTNDYSMFFTKEENVASAFGYSRY